MILIKVEFLPGDHLEDCSEECLALARQMNCGVSGDFNNEDLSAFPNGMILHGVKILRNEDGGPA